MINSIHLQNFQAHKDSLLEFHPGINAITGKSDNGKSSIVRALNYARYNRPASNNYPSKWIKNDKGDLTDEMAITIVKDSGTITRYRKKEDKKDNTGSNGYKVNGEILKAINRDVPEQVETILNLSEVNLQKQLDSHFLLADTPGQVAQFFNELVKMDEIDLYLSEALAMKTKNNKEIKALTELKTEQERWLESYVWIEKAEKYNKSLSVVESDIQDTEKSLTGLNSQLINYDLLSDELAAFPDLELAASIISQIERLPVPDYSEIKRLTIALAEYTGIELELSQFPDMVKAEKIIFDLSALPVADDSEIITLSASISKYERVRFELDRLPDMEEAESLICKIEKYDKRIAESAEEVSSLKDELGEYEAYIYGLSALTERMTDIENQLPETCPLCGNSLNVGACL